ncbi:MAG TPA: prolipoprotein diacylglyceryl transferase [Mycobacterium sp.]|nr:prolipoprotein diacylglyceryl transferase [Mycobacterium sp.]
MTTTVIAYFPSPPQGVWHLGPVPIRAYALFIILGIVAALLIGDRRWEARGGERGVIYDIALWAVPFGLIGGRLYHLATDWRTYFGEGGAGPAAALRIWDGGLGIWGAVALGGVGAWIACRRRGIPLPAFGDAIAPGIVLAQAIGRLGNYFNQELFGRETTMPWGLEIFYRRDPAGFVDVHSLDGVSTGQLAMVVQPTFLYELLWNLLVFAVLIYLDRRFTIGHGRLFALYVAGYCIGRFCIELLRDDAATHIAGIRINSFTSTFVFIGAVVYLILAPKGREDPASLSGSAADRLVPDSTEELEDDTTASLDSADTVSAAAAEPAGEPDVTETTAVDTAATDKPDTEAEAVAAEAAAAEVDAPEVEVTAAPEQAVNDESEPEEAESEAVEADEDEPGEAEPEPEEPESEAVEADEDEAEETEPEPEEAESEAVEADEEEPGEAEPGEAEPDKAENEAVEADDGETDAEESDADAADETADSADDDAAAEASADGEPTPEPANSTAVQSGWRQRLNSRLRRR